MLNELLKLDNLENVKIRFNLMLRGNWNPIDFFKDADFEALLEGQYCNYKRNKSYKEGQINLGFIRLNEPDQWLLFHIKFAQIRGLSSKCTCYKLVMQCHRC